MKPANFPERKRQRRLRALERLQRIENPNNHQLRDIQVLVDRTYSVALYIRTKKGGTKSSRTHRREEN